MPRKLKIFRTAVGFRDAYVAAPSRAAALRAWGTDKDLFARGVAEEVSDPELAEEALKAPGDVVYRTRGSLEEQVAALGELPARKRRPEVASSDTHRPETKPARAKAQRPKKVTPRPSRAELDAAEQALEDLEREREAAEAEMQARERALKAERAAMERHFARERDARERSEKAARTVYQAALDRWKP